jgi:hypothetical protein
MSSQRVRFQRRAARLISAIPARGKPPSRFGAVRAMPLRATQSHNSRDRAGRQYKKFTVAFQPRNSRDTPSIHTLQSRSVPKTASPASLFPRDRPRVDLICSGSVSIQIARAARRFKTRPEGVCRVFWFCSHGPTGRADAWACGERSIATPGGYRDTPERSMLLLDDVTHLAAGSVADAHERTRLNPSAPSLRPSRPGFMPPLRPVGGPQYDLNSIHYVPPHGVHESRATAQSSRCPFTRKSPLAHLHARNCAHRKNPRLDHP